MIHNPSVQPTVTLSIFFSSATLSTPTASTSTTVSAVHAWATKSPHSKEHFGYNQR